ncbi:MAG TPA: hypothetical protein PKE06_14070 [Flavilitoribacter sp.]|nr:hypothetical protein [Flavilitoribacter sp.]HMQ89842.1 hypothetical protein [Flavilitoribacter sp.]
MRRLKLLFACFFLVAATIGNTQNAFRVAFYNVENLFDTIDDPITLDEDFTPQGKQNWTGERYQTKLDRMTQVFEGMGWPVWIGLAEIENDRVLTDLTGKMGAKGPEYRFAHFESPDLRGIDVALLYQPGVFTVTSSSFIRMDFPDDAEPDYTSRDILQVDGLLQNGDTLHFFVNHWPSRRDGEEASEGRRIRAASFLKGAVEKLQAANPHAKIVIMGDFNDEPINKSIAQALQAGPLEGKPENGNLYNCFAKAKKDGLGSYCYRGNWNMLDQIITSCELVCNTGSLIAANPTIFKQDWMLYKDSRNEMLPNRTYGGTRYYGGYSDHLPVYIDLVPTAWGIRGR